MGENTSDSDAPTGASIPSPIVSVLHCSINYDIVYLVGSRKLAKGEMNETPGIRRRARPNIDSPASPSETSMTGAGEISLIHANSRR